MGRLSGGCGQADLRVWIRCLECVGGSLDGVGMLFSVLGRLGAVWRVWGAVLRVW